jgi:hypothetical protein
MRRIEPPTLLRLLHRLAAGLVRGEVHGARRAVRRARAGHQRAVGHVPHDERHVAEARGVAVLERVDDDDVATRAAQGADRVRPDVPGAPGDEDAHW